VSAVIERLGWTLLHSLWQGAAAWGLLQLALAALRRHSAQARYLAGCTALALAMLLPLVTFFRLDLPHRLRASRENQATTISSALAASPADAAPAISPSARPTPPERAMPSLPPRLAYWLRPLLPWLVLAWAIGCAACCIQLGAEWWEVSRLLRAHWTPLPAEAQAAFERLCTRWFGRRNLLAVVSNLVDVPAVVGWWKPVILIPTSALVGLSALQIEALLAHELAHVRRRDGWVNLLQAVSEVIFYFHPAIRAINRCIRFEREQACDDAAVAVTDDALGYARALAVLEQTRTKRLALAATGDGRDLLRRIQRLLGLPSTSPLGSATVARAGLIAAALYAGLLLAAPALTAEIMTASERIAAIRRAVPETWAERMPPPGESALAAEGRQTTSPWRRGYAGPLMHVEGEVHGPDGALLDVAMELGANLSQGYMGIGLNLQVEHGRFSEDVPAGALEVSTWPKGYAPLVAGPFLPVHGTTRIPPVVLTLQRGYSARVRFVDPSGQPIAGVKVTGTAQETYAPVTNGFLLSFEAQTSDEQGEVTLSAIDAHTELALQVRKPGFQMAYQLVRDLEAGGILEWRMPPAMPTLGTVVEADTGAPIPGARISLAAFRGTGNSRTDGSAANPDAVEAKHVLAMTDSSGQFSIDELNSDWIYRVFVDAPGHVVACEPIRAGTTSEFRLSHGLTVAGHVRGLPPGKAEIACEYLLEVFVDRRAGRTQNQHLLGDGAERSFSFSNLPAGNVTFRVISPEHPSTEFPLNVRSDRSDVVFDLDAATRAKGEARNVSIGFSLRRDVTPPSGMVHATFRQLIGGHDAGYGPVYVPAAVPVRDGQVQLRAYPGNLEISAEGLIGYWFAPTRFDITPGPGPLHFDVEVMPAGAISGHVVEPDGSVAGGYEVQCFVMHPAPELSKARHVGATGQWNESAAGDGSFSVTPLPLGGTYAIVTWRGCNFTVSEPVTVDAAHPLVEVDLTRKPGMDVPGSLVDSQGKAVAPTMLTLDYRPAAGESVSAAVSCDAQGHFVLAELNFDVPGEYELHTGPDGPFASMRVTRDTPRPLRFVVRDHP
jgi:beta-lactamase regulating signal transducer with metallopeptidase domain